MQNCRWRQPGALAAAVCLLSTFGTAAAIFLGAALARAETDDPLRLGREVVPTSESIQLDIDPQRDDYSGSVHVELEVTEPIRSFRFHAKGLAIKRLVLNGEKGFVKTAYATGDHDFVVVTTRQTIEPGGYGLYIRFDGTFNRTNKSLYNVEKDGDAYVFTQFEAEYAREAFPCWDEPSFKIPYRVTVTVPVGQVVISNTPIGQESEKDGKRTVVFEKTRPIPSYLLAIAAGPFESVSIEGMEHPGRIVTVKAQSHLASEAAAITPRVLAALEGYFGRPYPYKKLDIIAVPEFMFGAMENVGAVTFRDNLLLMDSESASFNQRRRLTMVLAHELAHMWFGNLVTLAWWDDLWLNEAFATWMGYKATDLAYPEYDFATRDIETRRAAMNTDALPSSRAIHHPFQAGTDPLARADELTYQKGQAVLSMMEKWLGEETFRQGMLDYLAGHEWGNATSNDLWNTLAQSARQDVGAVMGSFIDYPGLPLVAVRVLAGNRLECSQERFSNVGSETLEGTWSVPLTLKYSDGNKVYTQKVLLSEKSQIVELLSDKPLAWVHPNAAEAGYYRWSVPGPMLDAMARTSSESLTLRERAGFVDNISALLDAGRLGGVEFLDAVAYFGHDPAIEVADAVVNAVEKVYEDFIAGDSDVIYGEYVRRTLNPILNRIHVRAQDGEDGKVSALRGELIAWLGGVGGDEVIRSHALDMAWDYLEDSSSVDVSVASSGLKLLARYGGNAELQRYVREFERAKTPEQRQRLLQAMGFFRDPHVLSAALKFALSKSVRPQERIEIPMTAASEGRREHVLSWIETNSAQLGEKVPAFHLPFLIASVVDGDSEELVARAEALLDKASWRSPFAEKELRKVSENVQRRLRLRTQEGAAVAGYLSELSQR